MAGMVPGAGARRRVAKKPAADLGAADLIWTIHALRSDDEGRFEVGPVDGPWFLGVRGSVSEAAPGTVLGPFGPPEGEEPLEVRLPAR